MHQVKDQKVQAQQLDQVKGRKMIVHPDLNSNIMTTFCLRMMRHKALDILLLPTRKKMTQMDHMHLDEWLAVHTMHHSLALRAIGHGSRHMRVGVVLILDTDSACLLLIRSRNNQHLLVTYEDGWAEAGGMFN